MDAELTEFQRLCLHVIRESPEGKSTVPAISRKLKTTSTAVACAVGVMQDKGVLESIPMIEGENSAFDYWTPKKNP